VLEHDAYSGDYGLGFFGSSLEASATLVLHADLGPLCYLCDLLPLPSTEGVAASSSPSATSTSFTLQPRDAYRQRIYLEPLGAYLQADCGIVYSVTLDLSARRITVQFVPATQTPAGTLTYDRLRLRVDKVARPEAKRPGSNFTVVAPAKGVVRARAAFEIPAKDPGEAVSIVVAYED